MRTWIFFSLLVLLSACTPEVPASVGFLLGNYALVPEHASLHVVDVSDPTAPEPSATFTLPGEVVQVVANGRFAYILHGPSVTSWDSATGPPDAGLQIVDLSDPSRPALRGFFRATNFAEGLAVQDDVAYLVGADDLLVVDVGNPDSPRQVGQPLAGGRSVAISGTMLVVSAGWCSFRSGFCGGGLTVFDLTDPKRPFPVNQLETTELPGYDVALADGVAFAAGKGLWVVKVDIAGALVVNGRYEGNNDFLFPPKIALHNNIAYIQQYDGLSLLDISQPDLPILLDHLPSDSYITDLTVRDNKLYLAGWTGLDILDVSNPAHPRHLGQFSLANPIPGSPQPTDTP